MDRPTCAARLIEFSGAGKRCFRKKTGRKRIDTVPSGLTAPSIDVIESSFATIRHRTVRSKGCLSNKTMLAMIFKLAEAAEKSWRRLDGHNQLPKVILGIKFTDGIKLIRSLARSRAALSKSPTAASMRSMPTGLSRRIIAERVCMHFFRVVSRPTI
jgi:hypothetical protein